MSVGDERVELQLSQQAKRKWMNAPATLQARLISKEIKGKRVQVLTSMSDSQRYPKADIVELYSYR